MSKPAIFKMPQGKIALSKSEKGVKVLRIEGDFVKDTVPDMHEVCFRIRDDKEVKGVLLDFQGVANIDTSAFACIINFIKENASTGVKVGIVNLKSQEKVLAELLKVDKAICTFQDEASAIESLSK